MLGSHFYSKQPPTRFITNNVFYFKRHRMTLGHISSKAYQSFGRGIPLESVNASTELVLQGFQADATLLFDVDPILGMTRARARGELDRIERSGVDFFKRVRHGFLELIDQVPNGLVVDASQSIDEVQSNVAKNIEKLIATLNQQP